MKYSVGFIGCDKNNKNEAFPVSGWIVSKNNGNTTHNNYMTSDGDNDDDIDPKKYGIFDDELMLS